MLIPPRQAKINAEAVVGRVVGAITGNKKEGENIVDITTTIDLLQVFWEAEKVSKKSQRQRFVQTCDTIQHHPANNGPLLEKIFFSSWCSRLELFSVFLYHCY